MNQPNIHRHLEYQKTLLAEQRELEPDQRNHYRMYWDYTSPYSLKVKSYLNYKKIPYKLMQTTGDDYFERIPRLVGMSIIPVILTPDNKVMQDSTPIMTWFEEQYPESAAIPDDTKLAWIMWLIEEFSDEYVLRFLMRGRWGSEHSQQTMSARIARLFNFGGDDELIKYAKQKTLRRQTVFDIGLGVARPSDQKNADKQFIDLVKILNDHFKDYAYLLGDRPSIADFALFGQMIHVFRDGTETTCLLENHGPNVCNWIMDIDNLGDDRGCVGRKNFDEWLDLDEGLPTTLEKLVEFISQTYLPQALAYRNAMQTGAKFFPVTLYGHETYLPKFDYRAGTFAQLQQKFADLPKYDQKSIQKLLRNTGLFPAFMEGEIIVHPHFYKLTPPFVVNPDDYKRAYIGDSRSQVDKGTNILDRLNRIVSSKPIRKYRIVHDSAKNAVRVIAFYGAKNMMTKHTKKTK